MPLPTIGYCLLPFVFLPRAPLSVFTCCLCVVKVSARLPERLFWLANEAKPCGFRGRRGAKLDPLPPGIALKSKTNLRSALESMKVGKNEPENEPERTRGAWILADVSLLESARSFAGKLKSYPNEPENEPDAQHRLIVLLSDANIDSVISMSQSLVRFGRDMSEYHLLSCALPLVTLHQPSFSHNLPQFQNCRVADGPLLLERAVNIADRAGTLRPENAQDIELGIGRSGKLRFRHHESGILRTISYYQRKSSYFLSDCPLALRSPDCHI
jgi:hypothetical protein